MSTEQMRSEFEAWATKRAIDANYQFMDGLLTYQDGSYLVTWIDCAWIGWQASRLEMVVELPDEPFYPDGDIDCPLAVNLDDVKSACIGLGIKLIVGGEK